MPSAHPQPDRSARDSRAAAPTGAAQLLQALRRMLPARDVLTQREQIAPFECDALTVFRQLPLAVVLPQTEAQVQAILRLCHAHRVPVVVRGAGTGLSGGAMPCADGVLLSLAKLDRILAL